MHLYSPKHSWNFPTSGQKVNEQNNKNKTERSTGVISSPPRFHMLSISCSDLTECFNIRPLNERALSFHNEGQIRMWTLTIFSNQIQSYSPPGFLRYILWPEKKIVFQKVVRLWDNSVSLELLRWVTWGRRNRVNGRIRGFGRGQLASRLAGEALRLPC